MSDATVKILVELWPLWVMFLTPLWGGWLTIWLAHTRTMARLDRLEARLEARLDRLEARLDRLEGRLDRLEVVVSLEAEKTRKHLSDIFAIPQRTKHS